MKDKAKLFVGAVAVTAALALTFFTAQHHERTNRAPLRVAARTLPDDPGSPRDADHAAPPAAPATAAVAAPPNIDIIPVELPRLTGLVFSTEWDQPDAAPEFTRFAEWVARFRAARSNQEGTALAGEGRQLAMERQVAMKDLIRADPERALQLAVPFSVQHDLPESISGLLEKTVSDRGALSVFAALAEPGKENEVTPVWRTATLGGQEYDAYVYGRRLGEPTRRDIPLNGIALGRLLALSANPVRVLDAVEAAVRAPVSADPICAVSGQSATIHQTPAAAEIGGRIVRICGLGHADELNARWIHAEAAGGDGVGVAGDDVQASAYTEGVKRLLVIRVDFPDLPGDPFPTATGTSLISGLNDFYRQSSYDRAGFSLSGSGSSVTPTLHLTNAASYYGTNNYYTQLQNDARAAAVAAGFNVSNYDFDLTCFGAVPGWSWAGLGWVGASGVWLRNYFTTGVAGHELGHNFGLNHANYWDTAGKSIIGAGSSVEYGDIFDTMGSAAAGANHFNARYKSYLNWLTASAVQTVTNSGTYRIQAHDDANATGLRALKIVRNSNTNFWVEFRQQFTANAWMMNGAGLRWAGNGNQRSDLLDTTPGSANGKNDSALVVGRTFSDPAAGIHITTLRKAGTSPEALDVVVNLGTFPANSPPSASVAASATSTSPGTTVTFTATASDPNGDTLAYYWDFGDGTFGTNGATASKSWSTTSEYPVQCTVTDMKGGTATDSVIVTVGTPATYRISGQVTAGGSPLAGARVYTSASRMTSTDSDGTYALVGLPASSYTVNVSLDPYTNFTASFVNPVVVGPNATGINFAAGGVSTTAPTIASQPQSVTVPAGGSASFSVTATGTGPLGYTWRSNGTNVPGGTGATLSLANVQFAHAGGYSVVVTNAGGAVTSSVATLTVIQPPAISAQPQSQTIGAGGSVTLSVTASGSAPLAYQWRRNGSVLVGATGSSLSFNPVALTNAADYFVVVTNLAGSVTSAVATLAVIQAPVISAQPQSRTVLAGTNVTFTVTASGSAPLVYEWRKNGSTVSGSTNSSLVMASVAPADAGNYSVVVTNPVGSVTSSVATLVVNCSYSLSSGSASFTAAGGNGSVALSASGACAWTVSGVPAWITLTSASSGSGNAIVTYTVVTNSSNARSATLTIAGVSHQVSQLAPDSTPPVASITSPADGFTTAETNLVIQGTASDNAGVSRVECHVGTNAFATVSGTTSWSTTIVLPLGTNVVTVRCVDTSGLVSPEVQRTFIGVPPGTITVNVNGNGSVKGATNGQHLKVGKSYTVTAVAADGYAFSNWTGSIVQSSPTLAFVMETNLQVTANFVPNPFVTSKGAFNGLFYETNEVQPDHAGFFTFAMTVKGVYTASVLTRGWKLRARGVLDLIGRATNRIVTPVGDTYTITWALALDGSDQIAGTVTDGNWSAPLLGDRLVYHPKTNAATQAGRYTTVFLGNPGQPDAPGGDGFGLVTVDTKGTARLSGYLADSSRFVVRSSLSRIGNWPVYASLYAGRGVILGWVAFRDLSETDIDGVLSWSRPAITGTALYPAGFTSEAAVAGSRFQAPAPGRSVVEWTNPLIRFVGGDLSGPCTNALAVTGATVTGLGPDTLSVRIAAPSGLFNGVLTRPDTGLPLPFRGVIVQKAGVGRGYFLGTNTTGQVAIE